MKEYRLSEDNAVEKEKRKTGASENLSRIGAFAVALIGATRLWLTLRKSEALIRVEVIPGCESAFIEATRENVRQARQESGNLKFDLYRSRNNQQVFLLHEVFSSRKATARHKQELHYRQWASTVRPWMASPRTRLRRSEANIERNYAKII